MGNAGNGIDPGSGWCFADRASFPFVDDPLVNRDPPYAATTGYADRYWSPIWFAWRLLGEFVGSNWQTIQLRAPIDHQYEIPRLQRLARFERADAADEIVAQKDEFVSYFMGLLGATPGSHPQTYRLMHFANLVGAFMSMHFKAQHSRRRPSHIAPSLFPPVQVPGHPAYPSGHAAQAHLIRRCTLSILPPAATPIVRDNLKALAKRIARNREIAGLHFNDDSHGGQELANTISQFLDADLAVNPPTRPAYAALFKAAQAEWA